MVFYYRSPRGLGLGPFGITLTAELTPIEGGLASDPTGTQFTCATAPSQVALKNVA